MFSLLRTHRINTTRIARSMSIDTYLTRSWLRQHLYYLGFDLIRLNAYQKLSESIGTTTGGIIKSTVSDISTFINHELNETNARRPNNEVKELMYCFNNQLMTELNTHNISECRLFFICVGYMILNNSTEKLDEFCDRLITIYLRRNNYKLGHSKSTDDLRDTIIAVANHYYDTCDIDYSKLYGSIPGKISLFFTKHITIELPPLPKIHNKRLLAKALMHKELYKGLIHEDHCLRRELEDKGIEIDREVGQILRNDLSFYDGLGDYYLAKEASNLLYRFRNSPPYTRDTSFGKKSYTLLKTILATNTLLSRLALAYNLDGGLRDDIINGMFRESYVPSLEDWRDLGFRLSHDNNDYKYEQEFIADYFEQYVGTLYLELPDVAQNWINKIYENILFSISEEHRVPSRTLVLYDYHSWGVDVIGRRLK